MGIICFHCNKELSLNAGQKVSYSETCDFCNEDVRVCKNCKHYSPGAYNECKENQAERVVDKTRRNYCDFFSLIGKSGNSEAPSKEDIFAKMDAIFKKSTS